HDQLFGGAGADRILGGAGTDWLKGGAGNDDIDGGAGTDGIRGDAGDDLLSGGAGSDDIRGGDGDDVINGGSGRDWLAGGAGRDAFVFDAAPGPANVDHIDDFDTVDDVFRLDGSVFAGLPSGELSSSSFVIGKHAVDGNDLIVYDEAIGDLFY
ncbi:calcium-binding protein, partial [Rhizobiaceae sp. 2RAB30]